MGVLRKTGEKLILSYVKLCAILIMLIFTILAPLVLLFTGVHYLVNYFNKKRIEKLNKHLEI